MCVVAIALAAHPRWQFILAGNRDEFHERPTAALGRWEADPLVIAGRDLQSGGSWLGVSERGRIALVTNVRSPDGPAPDMASRGALVADWLTETGSYAEPELADLSRFNPFNLLIADRSGARFLTNQPHPEVRALSPGLHALSNGIEGEAWPRKDRLKAVLADWLSGEAGNPVQLLDRLSNEEEIQDTPPLFIRSPVYGTRCSTMIAIDRAGQGVITERRFGAGGAPAGETQVRFRWP